MFKTGRFSEVKDMLFQEVRIFYEPHHAKTCFMPYANNKGADQPAHPRSLISTFVVRCLDSIMPLVFISEIMTRECVKLAWNSQPGIRFCGFLGLGLDKGLG